MSAESNSEKSMSRTPILLLVWQRQSPQGLFSNDVRHLSFTVWASVYSKRQHIHTAQMTLYLWPSSWNPLIFHTHTGLTISREKHRKESCILACFNSPEIGMDFNVVFDHRSWQYNDSQWPDKWTRLWPWWFKLQVFSSELCFVTIDNVLCIYCDWNRD